MTLQLWKKLVKNNCLKARDSVVPKEVSCALQKLSDPGPKKMSEDVPDFFFFLCRKYQLVKMEAFCGTHSAFSNAANSAQNMRERKPSFPAQISYYLVFRALTWEGALAWIQTLGLFRSWIWHRTWGSGYCGGSVVSSHRPGTTLACPLCLLAMSTGIPRSWVLW